MSTDAEDDGFDFDAPQYREDEFPDWDEATSRMISGPLGSSKFPGTRFLKWEQALEYASKKYSVLRFWVVPGRWLARIRK